jgi:Cytochrome P450
MLIMNLSDANRDPAFLDAPDILDIDRKVLGHTAFGHGVHQCLGQTLARAELEIALPTLLRRLPGLRLAVSIEEIRQSCTGTPGRCRPSTTHLPQGSGSRSTRPWSGRRRPYRCFSGFRRNASCWKPTAPSLAPGAAQPFLPISSEHSITWHDSGSCRPMKLERRLRRTNSEFAAPPMSRRQPD